MTQTEALTFKMTATVTGNFTINDLGNLLSTALDCGLPWITKIGGSITNKDSEGNNLSRDRFEEQYGIDDYLSYMSVALGGITYITDDEGTRHELTREKLIAGLALYLASDESEHHRDISDPDSWNCMIDMYDASAVIEYALFGEVRYA